jgi:hypothetical protein
MMDAAIRIGVSSGRHLQFAPLWMGSQRESPVCRRRSIRDVMGMESAFDADR